MTTTPKELLVDVRSPAEFATGALSNDLYAAVNIAHQAIDQLPEFYMALGIDVDKTDNITLYCRSGRRSNIALRTLQGLGYTSVRDIGGFEEARAVLKREELGRVTGANEKVVMIREKQHDQRRTSRARSFSTLLVGLKGLQ